MARSTAQDPLDKFRFTIYWASSNPSTGHDNSRSGFQSCQMPKRNTTKVVYREGIDSDISYNSAGLSTMEDIVLSRGVIADSNGDFYKWIKSVHNPSIKKGMPGDRGTTATYEDYRKNLDIRMHSRSGKIVKAWRLFNVFPINFTIGSDLDASADDGKSIESLTLSYDDFIELIVAPDQSLLEPEV